MIAYGAVAIRALLSGALILFAGAGTAAAADSASPRLIAQASAPVGKGTRAEIQNVQRLLKLLSTRYPEKYGNADPKRVDGVFGDDTAVAIKNFQKTSGVTTPPRTNEALVSEILAALARMSALKPKQPQVAAATPKVEPTPKPKDSAASVPKITAPPIPRPEIGKTPPATTKPVEGPVPKVVAKPVTKPQAKPPVPKAAAKAKPQKSTATTKQVTRARPANDRLLYFVQVASLRDSQAARREWRRIRDSNRAALGAENVYFEKANIKGRGIFYRILVGPVRDRETAVVLCSLLKRNGQTCVTTRRNLSAIKDPNAVIPVDPNKPDQRSRLDDDKKLAEGAGVTLPKIAAPDATAPENTKPETIASDSATAAQTETPAPSSQTALKPEPARTPAPASTPGETAHAKAEPAPDKSDGPAAAGDAAKPTAAVKNEDGQKEKDEDRKIAVAPLPAVPPAPAVKSDPLAEADNSAAFTQGQKPKATPEKSTTTAAIPAPAAEPSRSVEGSATDSESSAPASPVSSDSAKSAPASTQNPEKSTSPADVRDVAIARPSATPSAPGAAEPSDTAANAPLINVNIRLDSWDKIAIPAGVALLIIAGVVVYGSRRRKQRSAFAQIFGTDDLSLDLGAKTAGTSETLDALEVNFKSDPLRLARRIRDGFLHDVLDGELGEVTPDYSVESAMRINRELKHLLSAKPDDYKSIFLNWMFLSEVGTALHQKDIAIDQLDSDIGRELTLLQNYFKIHLLELDDRHNLRENLPGIFYCLQLPPLRQRETAAISVA